MTHFKITLYSRIFFTLFFISYGEVRTQDITEDGRYGCVWQGGSIPRLLCYCQKEAEMTITSDSVTSFSTSEIFINGCKNVVVEENAIAHLRNLRLLTLAHIESISLKSGSINWYGYLENNQRDEEERFDIKKPSLRLSIYESTISEISSHAFAGKINELMFEHVIFVNIMPLAFVNLLQTEKLSVRDSEFRDIGVQSFKKFSTELFEFINVTANVVPSRAISNITVYQNVTIDNCNFNTIRSGGFTIYNPKVFQVTNTNISVLSGEAFKIISRGIIIFRNNNFEVVDNGALRGIILRRDIVLNNVLFLIDSNRINTLSSQSLSVTEREVQFRNILLNEQCDCTKIDDKIQDTLYYEEIMCRQENHYVALKYFQNNMCSVISNLYIIIIIVSFVIMVIVTILVGLFLYYRLVYRSQKYGDEKTSKNKNMSLIVPDGRTYRETELHVILERTDLLTTDL